MATLTQTSPVSDYALNSLVSDQVADLLKLQKAAQTITSTLDLEELIDRIVNDIACDFGCLEAGLFLHDAERAELVMSGVKGCTVHAKGHRLKLGETSLVGYVASTGQMRYAPDVRLDPYYMPCEEATLSEVAIPLRVGARLVGVFTASHHELDAFPPQQLRILQALCSHIAVAVQNAQLYQQQKQERERLEREAQEARTIQQSLLPKSSPLIPGFAVTGVSVPAGAVGGDWFDFVPLDDGRWAFVLADVSGKGMAAALLMSATRAMVRSLAGTSCCPGEVLSRLNRLMLDDFPAGKFVTMVYGILDPAKRTLSFANAGHLPPLLITGSEATFVSTERGMPLGLGFGSFSEVQVIMPPGSRLVFYSDGITEAENLEEEEYGAARMRDHLLRKDSFTDSLLEDVRTFANGNGLHDDATVVLVESRPARG
jgi:sigma-B regulation protein RsbU (phosphoserine phosphatase)